MKTVRATLASLTVVLALALATPPALADASTPLTAEQAQRDLRVLKRALTTLHPGLYRYITPAELDSAFARDSLRFASGGTRAGMFLAAARLAAMVRCGHTLAGSFNQSEAVNREVRDLPDKLPLHLALVGRRFLVTRSAADSVAAGDELLAIDGLDAAAIVAEMLDYVRADGANDGKRLRQLTHTNGRSAMDLYFPALHAPSPAGYRLTVRAAGAKAARTVTVPAMAAETRESRLAAHGDASGASEAWSFRTEGSTAWWTLPTFAFWNSPYDWKGELTRRFAELRERRVSNLVIDIRRNEGGDGAVNDSLITHLIRRPVTLPASRPEVCYERVPYALARFLDTWDFEFFDRTGKVVPTGGRSFILAGRDTTPRVLQPAAAPYTGRTFLLVGPENSSATFILAEALKRSGAATLVGQTTGGSQRGINGGELCWVTLPHSGVAVDIPLIAWMRPGDPPDAGITPDVVVTPRFEDVAAGVDPEARAVRALIGKAPRR